MQNIDYPSDPLLINRDMIGDWVNNGSKSIVDAAHELVVKIMKTHVVAPIDADALKEMKTIVAKGDKAFLGH